MRKPTTIAHVAGGLLTGYCLWLNSVVGIVLIASFTIFEAWQASETHTTGSLDFLDFIIGLFFGAGMGLIAYFL